MKKVTWTLYILFFTIVQNAQTPEINWGEKYSVKGFGKTISQKPIGHTDDYFFIKNGDKENKNLIQFDFENNIINTTSLGFTFNDEEVIINQIINTASGDYLLGRNHNTKLKKAYIHATPISANGQIGESLEHLYTHDYKRHKSWVTGDEKNQDMEGVKLSQDSTKVLFTNVTSNKDHRKKKYKEEYIINVFDDKLEKLWEKKLDSPLADKNMTILQYEVSNAGDVYILSKDKVRERSNKCRWCPLYDFTLIKVSSDGNVQKVKIDLGENYAKHARIHIDKEGNILVLGYFTERKKRDVLRLEHGMFFNKYDSNGEILMQKRHRWEDDFYTKLKEEYDFRDNSRASSDGFYIDDINVDYTRKSITLISEHLYQIEERSTTNTRGVDGRTGSNRRETNTQISNYARYLIIPSFDFDGNLKWTSFIERESYNPSFRGNTISYSQDGYIYLIFDDQKTDEERSKEVSKKKFFDTFTDFARINPEGEVDIRETIFNSQETEVYFVPYDSGYIGNGMMLLFCKNRKGAKHGLLLLP
ncbi:MAG: hypothetical protein ACI95T_001101 [Flavobacteriales bacterium]|jgi:hypothetical protein